MNTLEAMTYLWNHASQSPTWPILKGFGVLQCRLCGVTAYPPDPLVHLPSCMHLHAEAEFERLRKEASDAK